MLILCLTSGGWVGKAKGNSNFYKHPYSVCLDVWCLAFECDRMEYVYVMPVIAYSQIDV